MNDKVENLVLEQLRAMRTHMARMDENIAAIRTEMTSIRHHVRGVEIQQDAHHDDIASLKTRVDRIERRLELVDGDDK